MPSEDFDLFVIGAGSGGVAGSRRAAAHGARVTIAEAVRVGGTCVLRGCVPKKLLVYGSHFAEEIEDARGFGWEVTGRLDWAKLIAAKDREIDRLNSAYLRMLRDSGVALIDGFARLVDANTVDVGGRRIRAKHILIATGGRPVLPAIPGIEHAITSDQALDLKALPKRLAIVGGGYIALEFASIFAAAGVAVTVVIRGDRVLRGFDDDIRSHLAAELTKKGIDIRAETGVRAIVREGAEFSLATAESAPIKTDLVMYATGRGPNTDGMGLAEAGIALGAKGEVKVDDASRTSLPNVYAIGDCTDRLNLTPVAIAEGRALAETLFNRNPTIVALDNVPTAVFTQPPVGSVGLSEAEARKRHGAVDIYRAAFRPMKHTLSGRDERTMMKLVVDRAGGRVLGVHMVGPDSPEIIQGIAIAVKAGLTKRDFDATIALHPTAAEEFVLMRDPIPDPQAKAAE